MKKERFEKKLVLNKRTISVLPQNKMSEIKGGITNTCITMDPAVNCTYTVGAPSYALSSPPFYTVCDACIP